MPPGWKPNLKEHEATPQEHKAHLTTQASGLKAQLNETSRQRLRSPRTNELKIKPRRTWDSISEALEQTGWKPNLKEHEATPQEHQTYLTTQASGLKARLKETARQLLRNPRTNELKIKPRRTWDSISEALEQTGWKPSLNEHEATPQEHQAHLTTQASGLKAQLKGIFRQQLSRLWLAP